MTPPDRSEAPVVYSIDGRKIASVADFYREIGRAVNGPDGYFGRNLDALADCLRGGFGTPDDGPFGFEWDHSASSRRALESDRHGFVAAVRGVFDDAGVTLRFR